MEGKTGHSLHGHPEACAPPDKTGRGDPNIIIHSSQRAYCSALRHYHKSGLPVETAYVRTFCFNSKGFLKLSAMNRESGSMNYKY